MADQFHVAGEIGCGQVECRPCLHVLCKWKSAASRGGADCDRMALVLSGWNPRRWRHRSSGTPGTSLEVLDRADVVVDQIVAGDQALASAGRAARN